MGNKYKAILTAFFAAFLSSFITTLIATGAYAEPVSERGLFTDSNNVRWEYERITDAENEAEPESVSIMFYDKPEAMTTIVVPSLSDVLTAVPNATQTLDAYYVRNANETYQAENYTEVSQAKRVPTADTTVLDMTNTSKVQIMGVKPIINPEVETELIFGDNMVIGDEFTFNVEVSFNEYSPTNYSIAWCDDSNNDYVCTLWLREMGTTTIDNAASYISNYNELSLEEQINVDYSDYALYGCTYYSGNINERELDPNTRYCSNIKVKKSFSADAEGQKKIILKKRVIADFCSETEIRPDSYGNNNRFCTATEERVIENADELLTSYALEQYQKLTLAEQRSYNITSPSVFGCRDIDESGLYYTNTASCYMPTNGKRVTENVESIDAGAFAGYKLKLTNLEKVKYLGWYAFQHATFNEDSRDIVIKANQTAGEGVFAWTNVKSATFEGTQTFPAMFRDCPDLTEINFGNIETISYETFMNTNLGSLDFSATNVKTILGNAFTNAGLDSINLDGVQSLGYETFAKNNITELYLSKSLTDLNSARTFAYNPITKLTVAFDTMLMRTPLHAVMMDTNDYMDSPVHTVTDLTVVAPYGENDEVNPNRLTYRELLGRLGSSYGWNWDDDIDFAHADDYKNVIAPGYFLRFYLVENLTIDEGYEFIGGNAFYQYYTGVCSPQYGLTYVVGCAKRNPTKLKNVSFPESLKGIGTNAFSMHYGFDFHFSFPEGLEYIGNFAFANDAFNTIDFDLPNLRYLGTQAFWINGFRNITLHDSLEHVGYAPFMGSWNIHNLTIDYDVFRIGHLLTGYGEGVGGMGHFNVALTEHGNSTWNICNINYVMDYYNTDETTHMAMDWGMCVKKLGTITFTEKAVTEPVFQNEGNRRLGSVEMNYGWFYQMAAEKIDLSKTPWKRITAGAFVGSAIDTLLLPEKLEFIGGMAFVCSRIMNELTIPDTVKVINYDAFNAVYYWYSGGNYVGGTIANPIYYDKDGNILDEEPSSYAYMKPVKITKLPASLEYVGYAAFVGDDLLTADLNSPNLKVLGQDAFSATRLRDVTLGPKMKKIFYGALGIIPSLRNLTFDTDLWGIVAKTERVTEYSYDVDGSIYDSWTHMGVNTNVGYEYSWPFYVGGSYANGIDTLYSFVNQIEGQYYCADECYQWSHQQQYGKSFGDITFTNRNHTAVPGSAFVGMVAENLDMREAGWTTYPYAFLANAVIKNKLTVTEDMTRIPSGAFLELRAKEIELPEILTEIGENSFMFADVQEKLKLPETVRRIERGAFGGHYSDSDDCEDNIFYCVAGIEKLPSSLKYVGDEAFFGNYKIEGDLDAPNLLNIGHAAFMKTNLRDIVLHDTQYIGQGAFLYIPTIRNITLDCDFFEINDVYNKQFYGIFSSVSRDKTSQYQSDDASTFGDVVFTEKSIAMPPTTTFGFFTANKIDIEKTKWTSIPSALFFRTNVTEPMTLPETIESVGSNAFQWSNLTITNALPEGVKTIGTAAFFGAQVADDFIIPSTVESMGSSVFHADNKDVHYKSMTMKPAHLNYSSTSGQPMFVLFLNTAIDRFVIDSEDLPVMNTMGKNEAGNYYMNTGERVCAVYGDTYDFETNTCHNADNEETPTKQKPEFHGMAIKEVVLNNLKVVTPNAFEDCPELETVDFSNNSNLELIGRDAFINSDKLKKVAFGEGLIGKDVAIGEFAFRNTGIETIGIDNESGFNLAAANFNTKPLIATADGDAREENFRVFSEMPALSSVSVPNSFNDKTIAAYTFANNPELAEATIAWEIENMNDGTFVNDNKLAKLFVWGDTNIEETEAFKLGTSGDENNLTVPQVTNIFAYSDAPAEDYANAESRDNYEGKFYALDEVLYLTANKNVVILSDDKTDFDKEGLKLYGLRRDGVVLESDWKTYNTAFTRTSKPDQNFEEGRGSLGDDTIDMAALVFDAPKPFEVISLANKNFENVSYEFLPMPSGNDPLVAVHYPDGYTGNIRSTTLIAKTKEKIIEEVIEEIVDPTPEPQPEPQPDPTPEPQPQPTPAPKPQAEPEEEEELVVPDTGAFGALAGAATSSLSIATVIVLGGIFIAKKRKN